MQDSIWVLSHPTNPVTKTWKSDGTIEQYGEPKLFGGREHPVSNIRELSGLLSKLENKAKSCIIRGKYRGEAHSFEVEPNDSKAGKVLRRKSVHVDAPHHWLLVDVDSYSPFDFDPLTETEGAIDEFIKLRLPTCFHDVSYHWQLSSSAGHPSKPAHTLKAHIWLWSSTAYTGAQLRAWATSINYAGDKTVFDSVQVHYTAAPVFEDGVVCRVMQRSGFVRGEWGDSVNLVIPDNILVTVSDVGHSVSRHQKVSGAGDSDPVVDKLREKKMVKGNRTDGGLNVVCPRAEHHSSAGADSSTIYYPAHTGGHDKGSFVCLHDHCVGKRQSMFLDALGYDASEGLFDDLDVDMDLGATKKLKIKSTKKIPEAQHLCTDQANAARLIKAFKNRVIVMGDNWYSWVGTHWKEDEGAAYCNGLNLSKIIMGEADKWDDKKLTGAEVETEKLIAEVQHDEELDEKQKKAKIAKLGGKAKSQKVADALRAWAKRSEMAGAVNAAMGMAKKALAIDAHDVDSDAWFLNCANGTVDLRTGKLQPHDPNDLITKITRLDFNPDAKCDLFKKSLDQICCGDKELADFLQLWFGYCATGNTREQKFAVCWGHGRNGKSLLLDTISACLGEYSDTAAPGLLMAADKGRHPTEIAALMGTRMVTAHESGEGGILREDFVKQATGADDLRARWMGGDFFTFKPTHTLNLLTNYRPVIKGMDEGMWRRILLIPFNAKFGTELEMFDGEATALRDMNLAATLVDEYEGILAWIIEGARRWYEGGLVAPAAVTAATKEYQSDQDRVGQFISEVCELGADKACYLTHGEQSGLYPIYTLWCREGGTHALSKHNFQKQLERCVPGYSIHSTKAGDRRRVQEIRGVWVPERYEMC